MTTATLPSERFAGKRFASILLGSIAAMLLVMLVSFESVYAAGGDRLGPNEELRSDQSITSADGRFTLIMQSDGNVVLYQNGVRALWESATVGSGAVRLIMQSDGNLVAYTAGGTPVWASNTVGADSVLIVQDDGNLVLYRLVGGPVWATGTYAYVPQSAPAMRLGPNETLYRDQALISPNRMYTLIMQADGNVVVRDRNGKVMWATNTSGSGADRLIMQADGNLVLYRTNNSVVWRTNTLNNGRGGATFSLDNDGSLLVTHNGNLDWTNKTTTPPPPPSTPAQPTVSYNKDSEFLSGSGFLPNTTVYLRAVRSDFQAANTSTQSDGNGRIQLTWKLSDILPPAYDQYGGMWIGCSPGQTVTITANDGRWDKKANNYLWSNDPPIRC